MRRGTAFLVPLAAGLALTGGPAAGAADTEVPVVTHLKAHPKRFCARRTATCHHPGTEITFDVSTNARVRGDIRPRSVDRASFIEFVRRFKKGHNSVYLHDKRLTPDRWTLRLQATNTVGTGPITVIDVRVVKHG